MLYDLFSFNGVYLMLYDLFSFNGGNIDNWVSQLQFKRYMTALELTIGIESVYDQQIQSFNKLHYMKTKASLDISKWTYPQHMSPHRINRCVPYKLSGP